MQNDLISSLRSGVDLGDPDLRAAEELMTMAADEIEKLRTGIMVRDRYINRDIRTQIDSAFECKNATGKFPFED